MRVLIAPDKFKGTLTAAEAAEAIARGWRQACPGDALELLPITDGGDGFGQVVGALLRAEPQVVETVDAAHRPIHAGWGWQPDGRRAIIESASAIGLSLLPRGKFHPFELDTFGLGALLRAGHHHGAERCLVGIGGSATNDGGFGLARALGWQFLNRRGTVLQRWTELHALSHLHPPAKPLQFEELVVAVDVQNPLLGPAGCTRIYGPQKGLVPEDFDLAERCLDQLAAAVERQFGLAVAGEPGAGAAGGLGFGLRCFAGARLEPGFSLFARYAEVPRRVASSQLVLTGEGAIDHSTAMGKGAGELARVCAELKVPCIALAGAANLSEQGKGAFAQVHALTPEMTSVENAMAQPAHWLERLAARVGSGWSSA